MPTLTAMPTDAVLLTAQEVADRLRITVRTLQRLEADGHLPAIRIGRSVRYRAEDLQAFIDGQQRTAS